jgi:hypothetical protein
LNNQNDELFKISKAEEKKVMKLSISVDARIMFRDIYLLLMSFLLAEFLVRRILSLDSFS